MSSSAVEEAFAAAKSTFTTSANNKGYDFSKFTTIQDVYDTTEKIQTDQSKSGTLRHLRKIQPYLDCLSHYAGVIETFAQVKPDVMSLIWGPIKTILLITKTYVTGYDKILDAMGQVGTALPHFKKYAEVFKGNDQIKHVLCLFYKDILEFHITVLDFFHLNKRRVFFESIWPRYQGKIQRIIESISNHRNLMNSEATLANIMEAEAARVEAYQAYERNQEFQQRQDFQMARSSVLPAMYDDELEQIRKKCSIDAGHWLRQLDKFQHWLDPTDIASRLFGFKGFLEQIQARNDPLIFTFLSYRSRNQISTLKVLHSFIFQLASDFDQLRSMVCFAHPTKPRQLTSYVDFSKNLLGDMLKTLPPAYMVVDGLDEISEDDRMELIKAMLELHDAHENLHVLFCSRAEDDIVRLLGPKIQPTRVQDGNSQDIQAYVEKRSFKWLSGLEVDPADAMDIRSLMGNIGTQSKGMFLYARLVCDSLERQSGIDSIKSEASNLPAGLNEAYGRIINRISQELDPHKRTEARRVLEWVACSMSPVSKKEILLALLVARGGDPAKGCRGLLTNIVSLCGPIIEDLDGFVQFVHFSAREYLFHRQSGPYLNEAEAHATIASACVQYLSSDFFELGSTDQVMNDRLLKGVYVLENYTCLYWLEHVKKCAGLAPGELCNQIQHLQETQQQPDFEPVPNENSPKLVLEAFQGLPEQLHDFLLDLQFFWRSRNRDLSFENCDVWKNSDPLTTSTQQWHIRARFEALLCPQADRHRPECRCTNLRSLYGTNLWRCSRPGCARFRHGFETKKDRAAHVLAHNRPFKCSSIDCPYHEWGFISHGLLRQHVADLHNNVLTKPTTGMHDLSSDAEVKLILEDAVVFDDVDMIRDMKESVRTCASHLIHVCATRGSSVPMMKLILELTEGIPGLRAGVACSSILNTASPEHICLLLHHKLLDTTYGRFSFRSFVGRALPEVFQQLATVKASIGGGVSKRAEWNNFFIAFLPHRPNAAEEANVLQCMRAMGNVLDDSGLHSCLLALGRRCCSVRIAQFCIQKGAKVDGERKGGTTALWNAAGNASCKEAAEFMKFLLESGANPDRERKGVKAKDRPGAKNIHNWLGVTWDELVAEIQERRRLEGGV